MKQIVLKFGLASSLGLLLIFSAQAQTGENLLQKTKQAEALNDQAVDLIETGKFALAVELLREAIRSRSDYIIAYGNLGAAFYRTGQFDESIVKNDKQSAQIQYKNLAALDPLPARKLYSAIYANLLISAVEK